MGNIYYNFLQLKVHKLYEDASLPSFGTRNSACFDIYAYIKDSLPIKVFNTHNKIVDQEAIKRMLYDNMLHLQPGNRALIPTGLIFDIPQGFSMRIHMRSGIALKQGLTLINCEGVVDSDYVEQVYLTIHNTTDSIVTIRDNDRICQGELIRQEQYEIIESKTRPKMKSDRTGGFGSTGK